MLHKFKKYQGVMVSPQFKRVFFVTLLGLLASCAVNQVSRVSMLQAPEVQDAAKFRSVAIARIAGQYGDDLTLSIESAFMNAKVQEKPVYRNVVRVSPSKPLKGDSRGAMAMAKSQGVEAILIGEVVGANVVDSRRTTTEYVCTQKKDPNKAFSSCVSGYNKTVNCIDRKAVMQVNLQLIDSANGNSVFNESIGHAADASACGDDQITDGRILMGAVVRRVTDTVLTKLVPHDRLLEINLMPADAKIEAKQQFDNAMRFAAQNRMDRACDMFRELYDRSKESPALNYNLGVCEEASGAYWRANEYFEIADRFTSTPNKLITEALERTKKNINNSAALADNRKDLDLKRRIESGAAPQSVNAGKKKASSSAVSSSAPTLLPPPQIDAEALMMDRRVALVIGNAKYKSGLLLNPVNDARAITKELRSANFKVISVEDANLQKMNLAIDEFSKAVKKEGVALVFYAGHGMQVKGENYLIPVDAEFKEESEVSYRAINLGYILAKLEDAKSRVNIVILDACRDNPLARSWRSGKGGGLASIDAPAGTLIAFATAPGKTASDGSGANGLYTSHLLQAMRVQNQKIEDILKNTRKAVASASRQEQIPWDSSSMTGDFYFRVSDKNAN